MSLDKDFESTIAAGKRNAATMELIHNWCAHVRVEKFGGTGLIEAQTGYPIGHHSLQCDFAPMGGTACWDLRDSALDFYDSNCVHCDKRQPVGMPNISQLVAERDRLRQLREAEVAEQTRQAELQVEARQQRRAALRPNLSPVAAAILDDIATLDADGSKENQERLKESARLAPEHFSNELVAYIFELAESENWFLEVGLSILRAINADPARLTRLAVKAVHHPLAYDEAVAVLGATIDLVASSDVGSMVGQAVEMANPDREHFIGSRYPRSEPAFLKLLWQNFPAEVVAVLDQALSSRKQHLVEFAGRGFIILQGFDPQAASKSVRTMAAVYARANLLIDDLDRRHENLPNLNEAIGLAFDNAPEQVDEILQGLISGSDRRSRARVFEIYAHVLRMRGYAQRKDLIPADSLPHRIAFRRIVWAPTTETDEKAISAAGNVFRGQPYELELVAREEIEALLGAILILDDRLRAIDSEPREKNEGWLATMERRNRRSAINSLMSNYLEWAAIAAGDDDALIGKIIDMVDAIPDGRDELKGIALGAIEHLATSVAGLKRMLPHLYYGLVGPSALVRSYAATALGEIRVRGRTNIPPLVFEAFCVLLWDQYVIVHKSAVQALRRFSLPEDLRARAAHAVLNLLTHYKGRDGEDQFVVDCIERLSNWTGIFGEHADAVQRLLIEAALTVEPLYLRNELRFLSHALGKCEAFSDLVLYVLPHAERDFNRNDESWQLLQTLTDASVVERKNKFVALGVSLLPDSPWLTYEIVERLSLAGASEAASQLAEACVAQIPDNTRYRAIRTTGRFISIAHAFEAAIASNADATLEDLADQWQLNSAEQERQKADSRERRSRTDLPFSY